MIEAGLFDLEGTLVGTEEVKFIGWKEALLSFGFELTEELFSSLVGEPRKVHLDTYQRTFGVDPNALYEKRREIEDELYRRGALKIIPYAREAVEFFLKRKIPVAIVTQVETKDALSRLEMVGMSDMKLPLVCAEDVKEQKPNPEGYLLAAKNFGVLPQNSIVFEDTNAGIVAAKGAGMVAIALPNRYTRRQDFSDADYLFNGLEEAISNIEQKYFSNL